MARPKKEEVSRYAEKFGETKESVKELGRMVEEDIREKIEKRIVSTIGVAFAAGLLSGVALYGLLSSRK